MFSLGVARRKVPLGAKLVKWVASAQINLKLELLRNQGLELYKKQVHK